MNTAAVPRPTECQPVLKYVGGCPAVDFVNTADWAADRLIVERLGEYARLVDWAEAAGIIQDAVGDQFRRGAKSHPRRAVAALQRAVETRAILQRVYAGLARDGVADAEALDGFNAALTSALAHLAIVTVPGGALEFHWRGLGEDLSSILWPVLWSAAGLLTSDEAARIRQCGGVDCGWFYVDRSRNGLRRWCEMSVCGTREKNRRRARRASNDGTRASKASSAD
jgi:predicted RNA-binding Zn ribbon-like protein